MVESSQHSSSASENLLATPFAVHSVAFNLRGEQMVLGTSHGFAIYQTEPFQLLS